MSKTANAFQLVRLSKRSQTYSAAKRSCPGTDRAEVEVTRWRPEKKGRDFTFDMNYFH